MKKKKIRDPKFFSGPKFFTGPKKMSGPNFFCQTHVFAPTQTNSNPTPTQPIVELECGSANPACIHEKPIYI